MLHNQIVFCDKSEANDKNDELVFAHIVSMWQCEFCLCLSLCAIKMISKCAILRFTDMEIEILYRRIQMIRTKTNHSGPKDLVN